MTLVKNHQAQLGYLSRLMAENKGTAAQKDELQKLTRSMSNIVKNSKNCDSPVAHQYDLGHELGVTGTPAIFTEDGSLIPGYMPADELRSEEHTSELQSRPHLACRPLLP